MEKAAERKEVLQWHPAFYAGLQIELADDSENLIFENEHQLSTKPMEIDIIVIKKETSVAVRKNIGRIFRKYNIIEYKGPTDYLSVDDFYKVYGYTCFYKADAAEEEKIPAGELTMTLVCYRYPRRLIEHLRRERGYIIKNVESGICYIEGDYIPIQIIITSKLSRKENLWLKNLTNKIDGPGSAKKLVREYWKHKDNKLYQSVMNIIVRANKKQFQEVEGMCEALKELVWEQMKDEIDAVKKDMLEQGMQQGIKVLIQELLADLGEVPEELRTQIMEENDIEVLKIYHRKAARAASIEQFCEEIL